MAVVPLTSDEKDQLELHINALTALKNIDNEAEGESAVTACSVANDCLALYEERAENLPGGRTGLDVCGVSPAATLSNPEKVQLCGVVDSLTAVTGDEVAADIANEIMALYEERIIPTARFDQGQRDVKQAQLP